MKQYYFNEDKNLMPDYEEWNKKPIWRHSPDGYNNHIKFMITSADEWHYIPGKIIKIDLDEPIPKTDSFLANEQLVFLLMNLEPNNEQSRLTFLYNYYRNKKNQIALSYASLVEQINLSLIANKLPHKEIESDIFLKCEFGKILKTKAIEYFITPADAITWANSQGLRIPEPFKTLINPVVKNVKCQNDTMKGEKIISWKAIAAYLNISVSTAKSYYYIKKNGLLIYKDQGSNQVHAYEKELDTYNSNKSYPKSITKRKKGV